MECEWIVAAASSIKNKIILFFNYGVNGYMFCLQLAPQLTLSISLTTSFIIDSLPQLVSSLIKTSENQRKNVMELLSGMECLSAEMALCAHNPQISWIQFAEEEKWK